MKNFKPNAAQIKIIEALERGEKLVFAKVRHTGLSTFIKYLIENKLLSKDWNIVELDPTCHGYVESKEVKITEYWCDEEA